jgi:hypothetical protein
MDGNTRFARTFRIKQYTIDALSRIAEIRSTPERACTLTDALEIAVMRTAAAEASADHRPSSGELRVLADVFGRVADALSEEELADAPPADEMLVRIERELEPA